MPLCGEFFSAKEAKMEKQTDIKSFMVKALMASGQIRLAYRPNGFKFEENEAIFLAQMNSHYNLSVGDNVVFPEQPGWLITGDFLWNIQEEKISSVFAYKRGDSFGERFYVAGFFKLAGKLKQSAIKTEDIFCALMVRRYELPEESYILTSPYRPHPVLLFWAEGLKKIET